MLDPPGRRRFLARTVCGVVPVAAPTGGYYLSGACRALSHAEWECSGIVRCIVLSGERGSDGAAGHRRGRPRSEAAHGLRRRHLGAAGCSRVACKDLHHSTTMISRPTGSPRIEDFAFSRHADGYQLGSGGRPGDEKGTGLHVVPRAEGGTGSEAQAGCANRPGALSECRGRRMTWSDSIQRFREECTGRTGRATKGCVLNVAPPSNQSSTPTWLPSKTETILKWL